ncbi:N-6 DNA methylase [Amycolatopsis sp. NPDC051128]|uniref:N-6 DNA methylase n=1 Tax=Amycolatopsis sp. NPDC051128 TaxID=3155412 RepID=UPI00344AD314
MTEQLSATDIARLAGVKQAAISNWRKRHRGFPAPTRTPAGERYSVEAVAGWLDQRRIPANALLAGENAGDTFGARFRANLAGDARRSATDPPAHPAPRLEPTFRAKPSTATPRPRPDPVRRLWVELDHQRGRFGYDRLRDLVLGLLLANHVGNPVEPEHLDVRYVAELLTRHGYFAPEQAVALTQAITSSEIDIRGLAYAVSTAVGTEDALGSDEILDGFVARDDKRNAEFLTPESVARTVVALLEPSADDRILDPCCGSGSLLVTAAEYVRSNTRQPSEIWSTGWALHEDSLRLAKLRAALHGMTGDRSSLVLADQVSSSVSGVADVVLTNPPFNTGGPRFANQTGLNRPFGEPPEGNFNFGWLQLCLELLKPGGRAAVVMANGSLSSTHAAEKAIRQGMVEAGVVSGIVALPRRLFPTTSVPVCVWLLSKPAPGKRPPSSVVMVDATELGTTVASARRELTTADILRITEAWHGRAERGLGVPVSIAEIRARGYRLNPAIYRKTTAGVELSAAISEVRDLRVRLSELLAEVSRADAEAERQLDRISSWNH